MRINSLDMHCRYMAAPGTATESLSPFGKFLAAHGVTIPSDCSLEHMVQSGWIKPVLRIALPRTALEAWTNFPTCPRQGHDTPPAEEWASILWINTVTVAPVPPSLEDPNWWKHFLDDDQEPLSIQVRGHAIDSAPPDTTPAPFIHAGTGREVRPWIDFFAYWQAYQIAEVLRAATFSFRATPSFEKRIQSGASRLEHAVETGVHAIGARWARTRSTFDWLSRFRTLVATWGRRERDWQDLEVASRLLASESRLDAKRILAKTRNTLLVMWQDWSRAGADAIPGYHALRGLLRQDIEYALEFAQVLSGEPVDYLASYWTYRGRSRHQWAQLIDALPREVECARHRFADRALMYLSEHARMAPGRHAPDAAIIDQLVSKFWNKSRPLRRFCLAFHRLHEELGGEDLSVDDRVIRSNERIEQFLLTILHAERLLSSTFRARNSSMAYPNTRKASVDQLNLVLNKFGLAKKGTGAKTLARVKQFLKQRAGLDGLSVNARRSSPTLIARLWTLLCGLWPPTWRIRKRVIARTQDLLDQKASLHDLDSRGRQILVGPEEIGSGADAANYFGASYVNFVIARNYAAHHDSLDADFVYPNELDASKHQGKLALSSTLTVVVTCLQTQP